MNIVKPSASTLATAALVIASLASSVNALAVNTPAKRSEGVKLEWLTADSNHPVIAYRVLDKNSSTFVSLHVDMLINTFMRDTPRGGIPGSPITVNGCSGENNLTILPGESFECVVKYATPLTVVSNSADQSSGFVMVIGKGPK